VLATLKAVMTVLKKFWQFMTVTLGKVGKAFIFGFIMAVSWAIWSAFIPAIWAAYGGVVALIGKIFLLAIGAFGALWTAMLPFLPVALALGAIFALIFAGWDQIKPVIQSIMDAFKEPLKMIGDAFKRIANTVSEAIKIGRFLLPLVGLFLIFIPLVWKLAFVLGVVFVILKVLGWLAQAFADIVIEMFKPVKVVLEKLNKAFEPVVSAWNKFMGMTGKNKKFFEMMKWVAYVVFAPLLAIIQAIAWAVEGLAYLFIALVDPILKVLQAMMDLKSAIFGSSFLHISEGLVPIFNVLHKFEGAVASVGSGIAGTKEGIGGVLNPVAQAVTSPLAQGGAAAGAAAGAGSMSMPNITIPVTLQMDGRQLYSTVVEISGEDLMRRHSEASGDSPGIRSWGG